MVEEHSDRKRRNPEWKCLFLEAGGRMFLMARVPEQQTSGTGNNSTWESDFKSGQGNLNVGKVHVGITPLTSNVYVLQLLGC